MVKIRTDIQNDNYRYYLVNLDPEDVGYILGYKWCGIDRPSCALLGYKRNNTYKKMTRITTLLRTKYERTGEAISQLVRIKLPKINKDGRFTFITFDYRKSNLICRQSAFPTTELNFQEYVDRYRQLKGELITPTTQTVTVDNYPADRRILYDGIMGPYDHIQDCFDNSTIPGIPNRLKAQK